jgi:hypothetical protein
MARTIYHVTPAGAAWRVKRAATRRADSLHIRKSDAIARAQSLANRGGLGQVKVHRRAPSSHSTCPKVNSMGSQSAMSPCRSALGRAVSS